MFITEKPKSKKMGGREWDAPKISIYRKVNSNLIEEHTLALKRNSARGEDWFN